MLRNVEGRTFVSHSPREEALEATGSGTIFNVIGRVVKNTSLSYRPQALTGSDVTWIHNMYIMSSSRHHLSVLQLTGRICSNRYDASMVLLCSQARVAPEGKDKHDEI